MDELIATTRAIAQAANTARTTNAAIAWPATYAESAAMISYHLGQAARIAGDLAAHLETAAAAADAGAAGSEAKP